MRFEIFILLITGFFVANIYTDGKYLKLLLSWKKYYQMIGVALFGLALCWLFRKNPTHAKNIIMSSNEYLKYLPVDKDTTSFISPILDFTSKHNLGESTDSNFFQKKQHYQNKIMSSGGRGGDGNNFFAATNTNIGVKPTKRSVSETKKKFVASRQNWLCGDCKKQLPAWFEVDHTIRLEHGGSNHIDNLVALCRDCHGKKTTIENL